MLSMARSQIRSTGASLDERGWEWEWENGVDERIITSSGLLYSWNFPRVAQQLKDDQPVQGMQAVYDIRSLEDDARRRCLSIRRCLSPKERYQKHMFIQLGSLVRKTVLVICRCEIYHFFSSPQNASIFNLNSRCTTPNPTPPFPAIKVKNCRHSKHFHTFKLR